MHEARAPDRVETPVAPEDAEADHSTSLRSAAPIDIERLAQKVYRLMQADLRLEKARGHQRRRDRE